MPGSRARRCRCIGSQGSGRPADPGGSSEPWPTGLSASCTAPRPPNHDDDATAWTLHQPAAARRLSTVGCLTPARKLAVLGPDRAANHPNRAAHARFERFAAGSLPYFSGVPGITAPPPSAVNSLPGLNDMDSPLPWRGFAANPARCRGPAVRSFLSTAQGALSIGSRAPTLDVLVVSSAARLRTWPTGNRVNPDTVPSGEDPGRLRGGQGGITGA